MTKCLILAFAAGAAMSVAFAADEAPAAAPVAEAPALSPEQKAIADQANAFIAAYNKADVKALAGMFTEDADWVDDQGNVLAGRDAIIARYQDIFQLAKGRTLDIDVASVRPLTADVMLETGTATVTEASGRNAVSSYTAVHVKKGDSWLISQCTETGSPLAGSAARRLSELEWLVGSWADNEEGVDAKSTIEWAANNNFLMWTYTVQGAQERESSGTEIIGWDPVLGKIRSWVFEADGSFSEKVWMQDGPRWLLQSRTVLPDGGQCTEEQTLTYVNKDTFSWSSASRQVDGEALPNIDTVTVIRGK